LLVVALAGVAMGPSPSRGQKAPGGPDPFLPAQPAKAAVQEGAVRRLIRDDLEKRVPALRRKYTRYLTLTHLYNANPPSYFASRNDMWVSLSILLGSLTWSPVLLGAKHVDPYNGTILRVDIGASREERWKDVEAAVTRSNEVGKDPPLAGLAWGPKTWEKVIASYPYRLKYNDKTTADFVKLTGSELPYVRADWFAFAASRPPLYHDILRLPETQQKLEDELLVKRAANVEATLKAPKAGRVARAAFRRSGVSFSNRLLERHTVGAYQIRRRVWRGDAGGKPAYHDQAFPAAYWLSYDFEGNVGRRNLFVNPSGPGGGDGNFRHDGGEIIFHLPNGLQAYLLVDKQGKRLDSAPTQIVRDTRRADPRVVNGVSCMGCHDHGNNVATRNADELRDFVEKNAAAFTRQEREAVRSLHPPRNEFLALAKGDSQRVREVLDFLAPPALRKTPATLASGVVLADDFEKDLPLSRAAAELGLGAGELEKRLQGAPRKLRRLLGSLLAPNGRVPRAVFAEAFPGAVKEWGFGDSAASKVAHVPVKQGN
jgi:hypothetical protein